MNPDAPEPAPNPADVPPPIEVRAEPAQPEDRSRSIPTSASSAAGSSSKQAPPAGDAQPPKASASAGSSARPGDAAAGGAPPPSSSATNVGGSAAPITYGWATAAHLVGLVDFGFSFFLIGLVATIALWLLTKDRDAEADFHGKEAFNFQLNILFWQIAAVPLVACCLIGLPLMAVLPFVKVGLMLYAAYQAANGRRWRYPWTYRLLR